MSLIAWLDFSDTDRRKMLELVAMFKEKETRDELGLGSIRDGFADLLFPGTSTIQTRVHYFLFVAWIYKQLENQRVPSSQVGGKLWQAETNLINALRQAGETNGIIGLRAGTNLHRFPSSIYWNGLRRWGILKFAGDIGQYHRSLDFYYLRLNKRPDRESPELTETVIGNWDPYLPPVPSGFPQKADFSLSYFQAEYLQERIMTSCGGSLLAYLVNKAAPIPDVPFPWLHPELETFPKPLQVVLFHARNFSEAIHGASLLYNFLLAEKKGRADWMDNYASQIEGWLANVNMRRPALLSWNRNEFWKILEPVARIHSLTRYFVNTWLDLICNSPDLPNITSSPKCRELIYHRERWLKRAHSRFDNQRHLELWSGASGTGQLEYRWQVCVRHVNEITRSLNKA